MMKWRFQFIISFYLTEFELLVGGVYGLMLFSILKKFSQDLFPVETLLVLAQIMIVFQLWSKKTM